MIKITIDTSGLSRSLQATQRKIERCTAIALTKTAQHAQKAVIAEMPKVFDRPTPYAMRGTRVKPAVYASEKRGTTASMVASVEFKTDTSKGNRAEQFLRAEVFGGARRPKRFENALRRMYILPAGMSIVPGGAMKLDAFGNIPAGEIVTIMRYLEVFGQQGYRSNYTAKTRSRLKYKPKEGKFGFELIVIRPGSRPRRGGKPLHPGIWKRTFFATSSALQPLLMFVRQPMYQPRLHIDKIRDQAVDHHFKSEFIRAFAS